MEENYNCSEQCESLDVSIDQNQLAYRLIKLRIRVLRANIGKLLCLCVPSREKWTQFGWDGKTVDDILDDLSKVDIPTYHPGDPEFEQMYLEHEKLYQQYIGEEEMKKRMQVQKPLVVEEMSQAPETTVVDHEGENGAKAGERTLESNVKEDDPVIPNPMSRNVLEVEIEK